MLPGADRAEPHMWVEWVSMEVFLANLLKPFFVLACLAIGYPITHYVKHKMRNGRLRRFLLTELDPKKAARDRERASQ